MSFAQFLTLLVAACLVLLGWVGGLAGGLLGLVAVLQGSAMIFAAAVVLHRRGLQDWLPVLGWMLLGIALGPLLLPALSPEAGWDTPLAWHRVAGITWTLAFLALLRSGAGGWGDGALLALCIATTPEGAVLLTMDAPAAEATGGDWVLGWAEGLGAALGDLGVMLVAALLLAWCTGSRPLRRLHLLAWLGLLAVLMDAYRFFHP